MRVEGRGLRGLTAPAEPMNLGNSGTTLRLLPGILVGQEGRFELTGDESLRSRPVERIAAPLTQMGAAIETADGHAPLVVEGGRDLSGIRYELPVASAQVKSAVLLAGLYASGETTVVEPIPTRDHTEILLAAAGARVRRRSHQVTVAPAERLELGRVEVPGDFSSAAPFIVAATLLPGSELIVHDVGLNPTRTGLLDVLARMGARITVINRRRVGGEPVGDLEVQSAELVATKIEPAEVPRLIDELPLISLAAACARGETVIRGAGELRVKETDRIESVRTSLRALGARVSASDDVLRVRGVPTRPKGGGMSSGGDHRLAMLGAVAGLVSREGVRLEGRGGGRGKLPRILRPSRVGHTAMIVAIDGPAGAGKSTVASRLAERLGFRYLDTGAMYRALTWLAMHEGIPLAEGDKLGELAREHQVDLDESGRVSIAGADVTSAIRQSRIDRLVPVVARHPEVRAVMRERQRELAVLGDAVIEGRDIGTVVCPNADVKVYLQAERAIREERRLAERPDIGADALATDLRARDESDAARMQPAEDALEIDTSDLDVADVVDQIEKLVRARLPA